VHQPYHNRGGREVEGLRMKAGGNWGCRALRSAVPHSVDRNRTGWMAPRVWETPALTSGHRHGGGGRAPGKHADDAGVAHASPTVRGDAMRPAPDEVAVMPGSWSRRARRLSNPEARSPLAGDPFGARFIKDPRATGRGATWRDGPG
jgi:hypothetical protein